MPVIIVLAAYLNKKMIVVVGTPLNIIVNAYQQQNVTFLLLIENMLQYVSVWNVGILKLKKNPNSYSITVPKVVKPTNKITLL